MLKDMDIERDVLNFIGQNPEKKREIVKYCTKLGHNERTVYREINRLEKSNIILFDKSNQTLFLIPFITSLNRNLLKQMEKGEHQEGVYSENLLMLESIIKEVKNIQAFSSNNIKLSSNNSLFQFIKDILLDSKFNSIEDLNFEIKIKINLGYYETLACIKNIKKEIKKLKI